MKKLTLLILFVCALALCLVACDQTPANTTTTAPCIHKDENNNHKCDVCDTIVSYSENLAYTLSEDDTYYILSGIGTCADTDIVIPHIYNGLPIVHIGHSAFEECTHLTSVEIPDSVTSIEDFAFSGCRSMTSITIPDSVTSIGDEAFYRCTSLTSIEIPDSVTSIGNYAFYNCEILTSVEIGNSVTSIGERAFYDCNSLTNIEVNADNTAYKSIDGNLYTKDGKTLIQYAPGKTATHFEIPSGVTSIGDSAFYNCDSLTSIEIPDSVTSIGNYAFYNCYRLSDVYYTGTEEEWSQISIGSNNYDLTSATIHYNYVPEN